MQLNRANAATEYYDVTPANALNAGDIWADLPTWGMLPNTHAAGLVVTPACDLTNRKAEALTYIPIIPIDDYLSSYAFVPEIVRELQHQCEIAGVDVNLGADVKYALRRVSDLSVLEELVDSVPIGGKKIGKAVERIKHGIKVLHSVCENRRADRQSIIHLLGEKSARQTMEKVVTNAYRTDIHFLPADGQPPAYSAVPVDSVALFRHAHSAPIQAFDSAQSLAINDWEAEVKSWNTVLPAFNKYSRRPIKTATLRPRFLADLLTRFVGMYVRLGSPDFSPDAITQLVNENLG